MTQLSALVTGSSGFVGRHMAAELVTRGYSVRRCDILVPNMYVGNALDVFRMSAARYDLVVHCAARAPHRAAIDGQPGAMVYNRLLDAAMFDWAIRTRQRRVLYFSSSAAYPTDLQTRWRGCPLSEDNCGDAFQPLRDEGTSLAPSDAYGWGKLAGEGMAASARDAGIPVTVVRPFSGYGSDQGTEWPFGAFLARARRQDDPFEIWGDGAQIRDWIHIDDVVAGALAVVESSTSEPVNLCTGIGTSMLGMAHMMTEAVGYRHPRFKILSDKPAGVAYRVGSAVRLHQFYKPRVSLQEGIKRALSTSGVT